MSEEERRKGYNRLRDTMEQSGTHLVIHEPNERSLDYMEQREKDAAVELERRKQVAAASASEGELLTDRPALFEYSNVKRVSIHASTPEKMNDEIRIELSCGRVLLAKAQWGTVQVLDSRRNDEDVHARQPKKKLPMPPQKRLGSDDE